MRLTVRRLVAGLALASVGNVIAQSIRATTDPLSSDYAAFAVGARMLDNPHVCLYSPSGQATAFISALGQHDAAQAFPFANPPLAAVFVYPIAHISFAHGLWIFLLLSIAALAAAVTLLACSFLPETWPLPLCISVATAAMLTLPGAATFTFGQWDALCLLALAGALALVRRQQPLLAGICLACLLVKPQLVWLVPIVALVVGQWRLLAGFIIGGAVWAMSSVVIVAPSCLAHYPDLIRNEAGQLLRSGGVPGAIAFFTGSTLAGEAASVVLLMTCICLGLVIRDRLRRDAVVTTALAVGASVLAAPHTYPADLLLLSPVLLLIAAQRLRWGIGLALALDATSVAESITVGGRPIASTLICIVAMALLARLPLSERSRRGATVGGGRPAALRRA